MQAEKAEYKPQGLTHPRYRDVTWHHLFHLDKCVTWKSPAICDMFRMVALSPFPKSLNGNNRNVSKRKTVNEGTAVAFSFLCSIEFLQNKDV